MISFGEYIVILIVAVIVAGIGTIKIEFKEKIKFKEKKAVRK